MSLWKMGVFIVPWLTITCSAACTDTRKSLGLCDGEQCPASCVALQGPNCDVRFATCQERIFHAVECVRGTPGTLPEIRLVTEDELRAEQQSESGASHVFVGLQPERRAALVLSLADSDASEPLLDASEPIDAGSMSDAAASDAASDALDASLLPDASLVPDAGSAVDSDAAVSLEPDAGGPPLDAGTDLTKHWNTALTLLGLRVGMPALDQADDIAGTYNALTQQITLVNRGEAQDTPAAQITLAHEIVHALQDQQYGLLELRRGRIGTTDASLSLGCLIEGEAKLYDDLTWGLLQGLPVDRKYWDVHFERYHKYNRDAVAVGEAPWDRLWLLRYGLGARYLADAWLAGGNAAVARVLERPPTTTAHWMHGYAAAQARKEPLSQSLRCNDAAGPMGFKPISSDTFGAFTVFAFLAHNLSDNGVRPTERSWQRALAWRQDRIEVYEGPNGETALSWRLRLANASLAAEVAADLKRAPLRVQVVHQAEEIQILAHEGTLEHAWPIAAPHHCPPSTW